MIRFCPLASGSDGNSIYINYNETHILIDAGLSGKRIQEALSGLSVTGDMLNGIFVTHEHSDHIQGVGVLSRRFNLPVYATGRTWSSMDSLIGKIDGENKRVIDYNQTVSLNEISVRPFEIPHDASQPCGYNIFADNKKISVATDIGKVTDTIKDAFADSDILLVESNHDVDMLKNGSYPVMLKRRILSDYGHLSNVSCGAFISEVYSSRIKHVYIGHLSRENNRPVIAIETVKSILETNSLKPGKEFMLHLANRQVSSYCSSI